METSLTLCFNCSNPLQADGYFCHNCLTQFKCKSCDSFLQKDYAGCINCGTPKVERQNFTNANQSANTFKYHETLTERTIEATFSDAVGKDLSGIIRDAYINKAKGISADNISSQPSFAKPGIDVAKSGENYQEAEIVNSKETHEEGEEKKDLTKPSILPSEYPTLKAIAMKNLPNSETEWIVVYAFYASNFGEEMFSRDDLITQYVNSSRFNKETTKRDLSTNIKRAVVAGYINPLQNGYSILETGSKKAKEIIFRVNGSSPKSKPVSIKGKGDSETESKKVAGKVKKSSAGVKNLKRLTDLNFEPVGKESLESFINKFNPQNDKERNLLFTYYLQTVLGIQDVTFDHIYSCYDVLGLVVSINLTQTVRNTSSKTGWIKVQDSKISFTVKGSNQIKSWSKSDKK